MREADEVIYRRFLAGRSEEDLRLLFDRYKEHLTLFLQGFVGNGEDAEDLMMDTFAVIASGTRSFSGKSSFKTWLFAIGRNQARRFLRKRSREKAAGEGGLFRKEETPESSLLLREENRELYQALETLPDEYRQALYLLYFERMNQDEACAVMGKTKGQMYNLVKRGRKALREALERMGAEEIWAMR